MDSNSIFAYLFMGGFLLLAILSMIDKIYSWFDHSHVSKNITLRPDAKVLKVDKRVVGSKNDKKIQTIVTFDDGFLYETYKTDRQNGILSYKIGTSKETSAEIIRKATEAHAKACQKAGITAVQPPRKTPVQSQKTPPQPKPQSLRQTASATVRKPPVDQYESLKADYLSVLLQTSGKPLGDEQEAWNWMMGQIRSFKQRGLDRSFLMTLECNAIKYLTNCYRQHFSEFLAMSGDMTSIVLACENMLEQGNGQKAKEIADPYLQYLLSHPELYNNRQLCIQNRAEATLCILEGISIDAPKAKDNYTMFFVLYCRILDNILVRTRDELDMRNVEKEKNLQIAARLSPCNATVWEALAKIYSSIDDEKYDQYIQKALRYALREGEPYGLGTIYANLAMHYSTKNPSLARALCDFSRRYDGNPMAAELVLHKCNTPEVNNPSELLRAAGIQIGYSEIAKIALKNT